MARPVYDVLIAGGGVVGQSIAYFLSARPEAAGIKIGVVERDPGFGDAAFHAGRLAIRIGLKEEGRDMLHNLGPLMEASPEREDYLTELSRLN